MKKSISFLIFSFCVGNALFAQYGGNYGAGSVAPFPPKRTYVEYEEGYYKQYNVQSPSNDYKLKVSVGDKKGNIEGNWQHNGERSSYIECRPYYGDTPPTRTDVKECGTGKAVRQTTRTTYSYH